MAVKPLRVVLNKWADVDSEGRPTGVCPLDPNLTPGAREFVGMSVASSVIALPAAPEGYKDDKGKPMQPTFGVTFGPGTVRAKGAKEAFSFTYIDEVVTIPNTRFHREMIQRGNLFAADVTTYKSIFSTVDGFVDPALLLEQARVDALKNRGLSIAKDVQPAPASMRSTSVPPPAAPATEPAPAPAAEPVPPVEPAPVPVPIRISPTTPTGTVVPPPIENTPVKPNLTETPPILAPRPAPKE